MTSPQITYELDTTHETADLGAWFLTEIHTIPGRVRRAESWHIYAARGLVTVASGAIGPVSFGWGPADPKVALVYVAEANVETPSSTSVMHGDGAYAWDTDLAREQIEAEIVWQEKGRNEPMTVVRRLLAAAGLNEDVTQEDVAASLLVWQEHDGTSWPRIFGMKARPHVLQAHAAVRGLVSIIRPAAPCKPRLTQACRDRLSAAWQSACAQRGPFDLFSEEETKDWIYAPDYEGRLDFMQAPDGTRWLMDADEPAHGINVTDVELEYE